MGPLFSSCLLAPRRYWLVLLWTSRRSRLSGPVSDSPALPLASAELTLPVKCEALVASRSWLSLHVLTHVFFSACSLACCTFARAARAARGLGVPSTILRKIPPLPSPLALCVEVSGSRAWMLRPCPEPGWPPRRRHGRGFRRRVWSTRMRRWEGLVVRASASMVCIANGDLHLSSGFALLDFPRSCTRLL